MAMASTPTSLHKKTKRLGGTNTKANNNNSSSGSGSTRLVIVQPANLQTSTAQDASSSGGSKSEPIMGAAMSDEDKSKFLYEVARFGQTQEGAAALKSLVENSSEAMQASTPVSGSGAGEEEVDTSIASYQKWVAMQKAQKMGSTKSGGIASSRIDMNAHGYYMQKQRLGSTEGGAVDSSSSSAVTTTEAGEEAPAMQQIIPEKQVILRPMSKVEELTSSKKKTLSVPSLFGSTQSGGQDQEPQVYYYDAGGIIGTSYRNTPELTLPEEVFTASGQKLKLADIHDGGKAEVFLEMNPKTVLGKSLNELTSIEKSMSSGAAASSFLSSNSATTAGNSAQQSQDQMIVFLTVATMAIMVGMLSARRLRSRKFLEQCMTPDLEDDLDDVVRYDKKFDGSDAGGNQFTAAAGAATYAYTTSGGGSTLGGSPGRNSDYAGSETSLPHFSDLYPTQSSSIMRSLSRRSGYGTNDGGMHWRGDMEKFDV